MDFEKEFTFTAIDGFTLVTPSTPELKSKRKTSTFIVHSQKQENW
jgi:hypothetical protein